MHRTRQRIAELVSRPARRQTVSPNSPRGVPPKAKIVRTASPLASQEGLPVIGSSDVMSNSTALSLIHGSRNGASQLYWITGTSVIQSAAKRRPAYFFERSPIKSTAAWDLASVGLDFDLFLGGHTAPERLQRGPCAGERVGEQVPIGAVDLLDAGSHESSELEQADAGGDRPGSERVPPLQPPSRRCGREPVSPAQATVSGVVTAACGRAGGLR